MKENIFIQEYLSKLIKNNNYAKKLNDDIFYDNSKKLAISVDTYNEGVHFVNLKSPELVIKKIIRSSISDLICKGVMPKYYFVSASFKKKTIYKKNLKMLIKSLLKEQNKFKIKISGGDTTTGKVTSFTIVSVGFAKKIVERNNASLFDDIYVTGNIGDSFVGLQILKNKIKIKNLGLKKYFTNKYYIPDIPYKSTKLINKLANTSIDISDGLLVDLKKLINKQQLSYAIELNKIPISKQLSKIVRLKNYNYEKLLFNGDDYQTIFTAKSNNRKKILSSFKKMNQKISIIGKIIKKNKSDYIKIGEKFKNITNYRGYWHDL